MDHILDTTKQIDSLSETEQNRLCVEVPSRGGLSNLADISHLTLRLKVPAVNGRSVARKCVKIPRD